MLGHLRWVRCKSCFGIVVTDVVNMSKTVGIGKLELEQVLSTDSPARLGRFCV
jgi:hypothetical protein